MKGTRHGKEGGRYVLLLRRCRDSERLGVAGIDTYIRRSGKTHAVAVVVTNTITTSKHEKMRG